MLKVTKMRVETKKSPILMILLIILIHIKNSKNFQIFRMSDSEDDEVVYELTCTAPVNIALVKYWGKRDNKLILVSFLKFKNTQC